MYYDILTFNDVSFADFNTYYDSSQIFITPQKEITFYEIVGRSGDLSISNDRYKNVVIPYDCFIRQNFIENHSNLMNFLLSQNGYKRLENTKEPDIFRMAQFVEEVKPNTGAFLKYGNFTLNFNCKPQKWLKSGENAISIDDSEIILNPTNFGAKPMLLVSGTGTIQINESVLTLNQNTGITTIDCDIQDAYQEGINRNGDLEVQNGFPVLKSGTNNVSVNGCTIDLIPRWWKL